MTNEHTYFIATYNSPTVTFLDKMGTDRAIAEAAWTSIQRTENRTDAEVHRVIAFMARNNHWTPFAQAQLKFRIEAPIFVFRQWMRSNVGIVYNEESRRYVHDKPSIFYPTHWRKKPELSIKQGSGPNLSIDKQQFADASYNEAIDACCKAYHHLLDLGVAPEQARMVLPVSLISTVVASFSLFALYRVCRLRSDPHAQREIQDLAAMLGPIAAQHFPIAWDELVKQNLKE